MRTMFDMGLRKGLGQSHDAYVPTVMAVTQAVPAPPARSPNPATIAREIDASTRNDLLKIIRESKSQQNRIAAWWEAAGPEKARELLGEKMPLYSEHLTNAMAYQELVDTLEWRLSQGGTPYIKDSEIQDLTNYQESVEKLVRVVEGETAVPGASAIPGTPKAFIMPGVVAVVAYAIALM